MYTFNLLVVEDKDEELGVFRDTVTRYQEQKKLKINLTECKTVEEALARINGTFDGAIIDLKLAQQGDEGNLVIQEIQNQNYRIPIAVLTGTPTSADHNFNYVKIYTKGEVAYDEILDMFFEIYNTGLTRIFGGRGVIEKTMQEVFEKNIFPQIETWKNYVSGGHETEKAILRLTINHMLDFLSVEPSICFPEEMYLCPPHSREIKTGNVVKEKNTDSFFIVLSPACDLAHNGIIKTERILVCEIEKMNISIIEKARKECVLEIGAEDNEETRTKKEAKKEKAERLFTQMPRNGFTYYYHFLPKTSSFEGGIINFRKVKAYTPSEFQREFDLPSIRISSSFTKDIIARFSSYYARQGQPDLDFDTLADKLKAGA